MTTIWNERGRRMILTKDLAKKHLGCYVDRYRRNDVINGMFPKRIVELSDGRLYLRNPIGVYTKIEEDLDIDYIFKPIKVLEFLSETEVDDDTEI